MLAALRHLKPSKSDSSALLSDHVIHAARVITSLLSDLFTAIVRHGFMPESFCHCILVPIPKGQKDHSMSENYRLIALAPTLSKVLEWCILTQYSSALITCGLQFGFRQGLSATIATGLTTNFTSATFIVALTFSAAFLMPLRLLTLLIMAYCSRGYLSRIFLFPLFVFCSFGIEIIACRCDGILFPTAFDRVAFSLQFYLLCTWITF